MMMSIAMDLRVTWILALTACLPHPGGNNPDPNKPLALAVPADAAGPLMVNIRNDRVDGALCGLRMVAQGAPDRGGNWLPTQLKMYGSAEGHIKPGTYTVIASECFGGGEAARKEIHIDRTWSIEIDWDMNQRPSMHDGMSLDGTSGFSMIWTPTPELRRAASTPSSEPSGPAPDGAAGGRPGCIPDGHDSQAQGGDCCSTMHHARFFKNSNRTHDVCGPVQPGEGSTDD